MVELDMGGAGMDEMWGGVDLAGAGHVKGVELEWAGPARGVEAWAGMKRLGATSDGVGWAWSGVRGA